MKVYAPDISGVVEDVAKHFEEAEDFDDVDVFVLWEDIMGKGKLMADIARQEKKPVIVIQHGRASTIDYCPPLNYPFLSDKICVWGSADVKRLRRAGIPKNKIVLTGTPIFNHLLPKIKHSGVNVVFCPASFFGASKNGFNDIKENFDVANALNKIKGIRVVTKITEEHNPKKYTNPVFTDRRRSGHIDICAVVLREADIVVSVLDGTFALLAYALDIPVIIPKVWEPKKFRDGLIHPVGYSKACDLIDLDKLKQVVELNLEDPRRLRKERREVAMVEGGMGLRGNPEKKIVRVIKSVAKKSI